MQTRLLLVRLLIPIVVLAIAPADTTAADETRLPREVSGIYPQLAMFNEEGECGTGAVVPWADRLWVITYAPHRPDGSTDKLYEITPDLKQIVRSESVGGTPANRMIHRETDQLLIGPYVVDAKRGVRVITPKVMSGRLTGVARHLVEPATHVYYATMEEGLYSVDLRDLSVTDLIRDGNSKKEGKGVKSKLPGYHGKGLYSGQGRVVYANNGERSVRARVDPETPSGALAEWRQPGQDWSLVRRNQFTEVTGPGGIYGNPHPETDPLWSIGWDNRSLILMCLDNGKWTLYRLPKGSHSYDGAHGWNTEWPRIRDIGEDSLLMTMHGTFWKFPKDFSPKQSKGIAPRSNYLKVIGDFARWNDRLVFGCDDTARNEFLNKRAAKGDIAAPGQSQSNLWFTEPDLLDDLGPAIGRGAVWLNDDVEADTVSDPYLFSGFDYRSLFMTHKGEQTVSVQLEIDRKGDGQWTPLRTVDVPPGKGVWTKFSEADNGAWIRLKPESQMPKATAFFQYRNKDMRSASASTIFSAIASSKDDATGGLIYALGDNQRKLRYAAQQPDGSVICYDLDGDLNFSRTDDPAAAEEMQKMVAIPAGVLSFDEASIVYTDQSGSWRLPRGDQALDAAGHLGAARVCREVCTERDLFNAGGVFYELPAENAGGTRKLRAITTHNRRIKDYGSYRGLFVMSGLKTDAAADKNVIRSEDGKAALWVGVVDDLWKFGKPRGFGGPWKDTPVKAGVPSDPYLMTGFDKKTLQLSHSASENVNITLELDVTGTGDWVSYQTFEVPAGKEIGFEFPPDVNAYWLRLTADRDCKATGQLNYQ